MACSLCPFDLSSIRISDQSSVLKWAEKKRQKKTPRSFYRHKAIVTKQQRQAVFSSLHRKTTEMLTDVLPDVKQPDRLKIRLSKKEVLFCLFVGLFSLLLFCFNMSKSVWITVKRLQFPTTCFTWCCSLTGFLCYPCWSHFKFLKIVIFIVIYNKLYKK